LRNGEHHFPTIRDALLIIVITLLLVTSAGILWETIGAKWELLLLELFIIVPVLVFIFIRGYSFPDLLRWKKANLKTLFASGLIGLGIIPISDELDHLIQMIFPMPDEMISALETFLVIHSTEEWIILILGGVLVASISEELLFRGFLQSTLEQTMKPAKAVIISACLFAVVHFNPWWIITIWMAGVLLGFLAWRSGSIIPGIVVHTINNGLAVLLTNMDIKRLEGLYYMKNHVSPLFIVAGIAYTVWGLILFYRFTENRETIERHSDQLRL
jgi:sodium transport system permease protein